MKPACNFLAIHIGGDEVAQGAWKESPIARKYMKKHGIKNERDLHLIYIKELVERYAKLGIPVSGWRGNSSGTFRRVQCQRASACV